MNRTLIAVLLVIVAVPAWALGTETPFKDVPFGTTEKEFSKKLPGYKCQPNKSKDIGDRVCIALGRRTTGYGFQDKTGTFAGVPADIYVYFFDNKMSSVALFIYVQDFDKAGQLLITKHGMPETLQSSVVTNASGQKFDNLEYAWKRPEVDVTAAKYQIDQNTSRILYISAWGKAEAEKRQNRAAKK